MTSVPALARTLILAPALLLGACVAPPPPEKPDADACKASTYQGLVGQPKTVLDTMMLPARSRVIGPGDAITMDFSPQRLNVEIGKDDRIAKVACY